MDVVVVFWDKCFVLEIVFKLKEIIVENKIWIEFVCFFV